MNFENYAGKSGVTLDADLITELTAAGITAEVLPEVMRRSLGQVHSIVIGTLHGWTFKRSWKYWIAKGPGIPVKEAEDLHSWYGKVVRVDGDCTCPSPKERFKGLGVGIYHVDTSEGLMALANTIKEIVCREEVNE